MGKNSNTTHGGQEEARQRAQLALVLISLVVSCHSTAVPSPRVVSEPSSLDQQQAVEVLTLVEMVKTRPLDVAEIEPLLGAMFSGDSIRLSTTRVDPLSPNTLVESFDEWHFAARLQLLLDYASWQLALERPRLYSGAHADDQRRLDREADLRIANLVREAGYEEAWRPFTAVYTGLVQEVSEKAFDYRNKTGDDSPFELMRAIDIDQIARSHFEGVIDRFPVDSQVVAYEMLRLLAMTREMLGVSREARLDQYLFHACGAGRESRIVTNAGHPLAPVLSVARFADSTNAAANTIKSSYLDLVNAYESWTSNHPTASPKDQLERVRVLTQQFQVMQQLEQFREADVAARGGPR